MPSLVVVAREQGEGEAVWEKHEKEVTRRKRGGVFAGGLVLSRGKFHGTAPHLCGQIRKSLTLHVTVGCFISNCRKDRGRFYDRVHFLWPCELPSGFLALCELRAEVKGQGSAKLLEGVSLPCQPAGYYYRFQLRRTLSLFLSVPAESILLPDCYFFLQPCFPGVRSTSLSESIYLSWHPYLFLAIACTAHKHLCGGRQNVGLKTGGWGFLRIIKKAAYQKLTSFFRSLSGTACSTNPVENGTGGGVRPTHAGTGGKQFW